MRAEFWSGEMCSVPRYPLTGVGSELLLHHKIRTSVTRSRLVRMTNTLPPKGGQNKAQPRVR